MKELAPIVLFVYNRPWHTQQTLEALYKNQLASDSVLYIFADGPKENIKEDAANKIAETRSIIKSKQWCKNVIIIESEFNKGLAASIIDGVTSIVNKHNKVIVLEDDLVTSAGFLRYMNDALNLYESAGRVMHISGYMFPVRGKLPTTFFYNTASCWGWGTWKRAWDKLETDPNILKEKIMISPGGIERFNIENGYNFFSDLENNISGKIKTWGVRWYATIFINEGYSLHPGHSLVNNTGHDASGENCGANDMFWWKKLADKVEVKKINEIESKEVRKKIRHYLLKPNRENNLINVIKNNIPRSIKTRLKNAIRK